MKKHLAALERGKNAAKLMRHAKLQPYLGKITPHLPRLAPHAGRIIDEFEVFGPWVPVLIDELPQLLPHMEALLDELPHLAPHLEALVEHREVLLAHLDYIVPHMAALRPHLSELASGMPIVTQLVPRIAPHLAALLPHMKDLLARAKVLAETDEKLLIRIAGGEQLQLLLPYLGPVAPHLDKLAPHLPKLLELQRERADLRLAIPNLFANIKQLLPYLGFFLSEPEGQDVRIALLRAERIDELLDELFEMAPPPEPKEEEGAKEEEEASGWWGAVTRMFGGEGAAKEKLDLTEINSAIDGANRRMAKLEEEFVGWKNTHSHRAHMQQNEVARCSKLEATLADVDEGLVSIRSKLMDMRAALDDVEKTIEPNDLMQAREARQIEMINGSNDPLASTPNAIAASPMMMPPMPPLPPLTGASSSSSMLGPPSSSQSRPSPRRSSFMSLVEDGFLSKLAL